MTRSLLVLALFVGCSSSSTPDAGSPFERAGTFAVGSLHTTIHDADGGRALPVELWYPAEESARAEMTAGFPVAEFEEGARRTQLQAWIEQAPERCTPRTAHSARNATPASNSKPWPLLLFSHCTECFRFSMHSLAERLASHGYVVAAPDHVTNTFFDAGAPLTNAFLAVRAADVSSVLTALLDANASEVPTALRGKLDASKVAVIGHSFGAVTAGKVVEFDARVRAGFLIAAPVDSPFLNSGSLPNVKRPLSWLLAQDDNSISYLGNQLIRENFAKAPRDAWLVEVANAGHWTFTDIAGLGGSFLPGCGSGTHEPDGGTFDYLDNDVGRSIAQRTVTAWAAHVLNADPTASEALSTATPVGVVTVKQR